MSVGGFPFFSLKFVSVVFCVHAFLIDFTLYVTAAFLYARCLERPSCGDFLCFCCTYSHAILYPSILVLLSFDLVHQSFLRPIKDFQTPHKALVSTQQRNEFFNPIVILLLEILLAYKMAFKPIYLRQDLLVILV